MEQHPARNVARRIVALTAALVLSAVSYAGGFQFVSGTWSNLTGTATSTSTLYQTNVTPNGVGGSLTVSAPYSGTQTLQGTWGFTISWFPATTGEVAPPYVEVTLRRNGTPTLAGDGAVQILQGTTPLLAADSTYSSVSGVTAYLPDVIMTLPLTLQSNGTYQATGSITSDLLSATYNDASSVVTSCAESFTVSSMDPSNSVVTSTGSLPSPNYLWGVSLVNSTITQSSGGNATVAGIFGVEGGGSGAGQITSLTLPPYYAGTDTATSGADIRASLTIQAYWCGPNPPATLYLNDFQNGTAQYSLGPLQMLSGVSRPRGGASGEALAEVGAGRTSVEVTNSGLLGISETGFGMFYAKDSITLSGLSWVKLGTLGPTPSSATLWALAPASRISYSVPQVSVFGSITFGGAGDDESASATSLSVSALGLGYRVSTQSLPAVFISVTHLTTSKRCRALLSVRGTFFYLTEQEVMLEESKII